MTWATCQASENEDGADASEVEEEEKEVMYDSEENEIEAPVKFQPFVGKKG